MTDMSAVIVPKSDQMNSDDLIPGPRTITITRVDIRPGAEQPVSIFFEGDNGKPWKPCKSMARVLVYAWGPDAKAYEGRSVTLYRDPSVKWGGIQVGGIRISHMSNIDRDMVIALTETKGKRAPFQVRALRETAAPAPSATLEARADKFEQALRAANDAKTLARIWDNGAGLRADLSANNAERAAEIERLHVMLDAELSSPAPAYADDFPGDRP